MKLSEIWIYPVKGLRGVPLQTARVEPWGLEGDRRWMIVDDDGRFLSQRQLPAMARIGTALIDGSLVLSADGGRIEVALPATNAERIGTRIWVDRVAAPLASADANAWLSDKLGVACRLVHMPDPATAREVDRRYSVPGDVVSFADGYPVLVTAMSSLDDLNIRLGYKAVPMTRFRPNLVVGGSVPWAEDHWVTVTCGEAAFAGVKPCARCVVTTIDQRSGVRDPANEPIHSLAEFRGVTRGKIIFGQNLIPRGGSRVSVGDAVTASGA